jgi:translation initiation factor IF-3
LPKADCRGTKFPRRLRHHELITPLNKTSGFLFIAEKALFCYTLHTLKTLATEEAKVNHQIRAKELRVIGPKGENFGVISLSEALKHANEAGLDLIEISPDANPPVAKIADYGKFSYEAEKKRKAAKQKAHTVEVKNLQVKIGTGDHDLALKAKKASEWLAEGNKIRIDLFLPGRSKYLEADFLKDRLDRILRLISVPFKVAEEAKKSPKGMTIVVEKGK